MPGGGIEFSDVARLLTCEQFARRELRMRGNRAQCPFHGGERYNLAFYRDGKCYCHVCHKVADVVGLAAATWHTNQMDAARLLNDEYRLGLSGSVPTDEQRRRRDREREAHERAALDEREQFKQAFDELFEARANIEKFTIADAEKPEFQAALIRLGKAQDKLELLELNSMR